MKSAVPGGAARRGLFPIRDICTHQAAKDAAVIWHHQVEKFVDENKLLEVQIFVEKIDTECHCSTR